MSLQEYLAGRSRGPWPHQNFESILSKLRFRDRSAIFVEKAKVLLSENKWKLKCENEK